MKHILVTGARGFAGSYLCAELLAHGYTVEGLDLNADSIQSPWAARLLPSPDQLASVPIHTVNLQDRAALENLLITKNYTAIYHLAGSAFVPLSWKSPVDTLENNTIASLNILQAARQTHWQGRFLYISSGEVYGAPTEDFMPITESTPLAPGSPYAQSKLTTEKFAAYYRKDGLEVLIARPFNHTGPGQRNEFVIPAFLKRIQKAIQCGENSIEVGDLDSVRDFSDVRDVARAYRMIMEHGVDGAIYNICSGRQTRIGDVLETTMRAAGVQLQYKINPDFLRPEGSNKRWGNPARLCKLGWESNFHLDTTIKDMWQCLQNSNSPEKIEPN